jgi:hypothetical protein
MQNLAKNNPRKPRQNPAKNAKKNRKKYSKNLKTIEKPSKLSKKTCNNRLWKVIVKYCCITLIEIQIFKKWQINLLLISTNNYNSSRMIFKYRLRILEKRLRRFQTFLILQICEKWFWKLNLKPKRFAENTLLSLFGAKCWWRSKFFFSLSLNVCVIVSSNYNKFLYLLSKKKSISITSIPKTIIQHPSSNTKYIWHIGGRNSVSAKFSKSNWVCHILQYNYDYYF